MSKSKLDIFAAIAGRLRNAFRINGQSTDGTQDVIIEKLGLSTPVDHMPQSLLENNLLVENGYLAFRTLGSNIDPTRFITPGTYISCTCLMDTGTLTLSVIEEATGDVYIYTASAISTEWTLKSKVGRADGSVETAERLAVGRKINGTSFDGSQDVSTLNWGPSVDFSLTGAVTGTVSGQKGNVPVSIATTLSSTGVTAGAYAKVTVGADGRVISGGTLVQTDIPSLPASRITSGELDSKRLPMVGIDGTLAQLNGNSIGNGYVKIKLPSVFESKFISFNITTVSEISGYNRHDLTVTGYLHANWVNAKVYSNNDRPSTGVVVGKEDDGTFYVSVYVDLHLGVRVHGLTVAFSSDYRNEVTTAGWSISLDETQPNPASVTIIQNVRSDNIGTYLPNLDASKLTSGVLANARIPALNASKVTSGTFDLDRIPSLPVSKVPGAAVSGSRIAGTCLGEARPAYNTAAIEAGAPNVAATFPTYSFHKFGVYASTLSAISAYEFAFYRQDGITLAHLDAYLNGGLINRGEVPAVHIANLDASKIATGTFHIDRIPSIPTTKVTGLGGLSTKNIIISTAEPDNNVGVEGDLWGVIE